MGRAVTSVLVASAFLVLLISGTVLFVSPPGRVANWTDWKMLGLTKHDWSGVHVWFAILFITAAVFHLIFNLRPLLNYFKDRVSRRLSLRREWVTGVSICGLVFAGTQAGLPPFSTVLAMGESVKKSWEQPATAAPIAHAELLSLKELAEKAAVPFETAVDRLEARGYLAIRPDTVVAQFAVSNNITPQRVYEVIQGPRAGGGGGGHGPTSGEKKGGPGGGGLGGGGGGTGRLSLQEFCASRNLDVQATIARLKTNGITATPSQTLRDVAQQNGYDRPYEIMELLEQKH